MEGWREVRMKFGSQQMVNWSSMGVVVVVLVMMMMVIDSGVLFGLLIDAIDQLYMCVSVCVSWCATQCWFAPKLKRPS